jgi:hypothetical protein
MSQTPSNSHSPPTFVFVSVAPPPSTLTVALNKRTRDAIRRANVRLTVRITVIDGAGNRSRQTRVLRSQTLGQRRG